MQKLYFLTLFIVFIGFLSFNFSERNLDNELTFLMLKASNGNGLNFFKLPDSNDLDKIPQDKKNDLNPAKVELGKFMFNETALALTPKKSSSKKS